MELSFVWAFSILINLSIGKITFVAGEYSPMIVCEKNNLEMEGASILFLRYFDSLVIEKS